MSIWAGYSFIHFREARGGAGLTLLYFRELGGGNKISLLLLFCNMKSNELLIINII